MHNKHDFSVKIVTVIILSLLLFSIWGLALVLVNDDNLDPRNRAADNAAATITVCDSGCDEVDINVALSKVANEGMILIKQNDFDGPAIISRESSWQYKLPTSVRTLTIKGDAQGSDRLDWRFNEVAPNGHIIEINNISNVKVIIQNLALKNSSNSTIHLYDNVSGVEIAMNNAEIEGSSAAGLYMSGQNNKFDIANSTFGENTGSALSIHGSIQDSKVSSSIFKKHVDDALGFNISNNSAKVQLIKNQITGFANHGVYIINNSNIEMFNNLITPKYENGPEIGQYGVEVKDSGSLNIVNNIIDGQDNLDTGIKFAGQGNVKIINNIIVNTDIGIEQASYSGNKENDYNILFGNQSNYVGLNAGSNNKTVDPKFKDSNNGDYTLLAGSPAINAGDPEINDLDNTRSDIGLYGGPYATGTGGNTPNPTNCGPAPENGSFIDFNSDGEVDIRDFVCFRNEYVANV